MLVDNHYTLCQPKFGKLITLRQKGLFNDVNSTYQGVKVQNAFYFSDEMTKFCQKYDVNAVINFKSKKDVESIATLTLKTKKIVSGFWKNIFNPSTDIKFVVKNQDSSRVLPALEEKIKLLKFSELEKNLCK